MGSGGRLLRIARQPRRACQVEWFSDVRSRTDRSQKSGVWSGLGLFFSPHKKYKHSHFPATRAGGFLPNHSISVSIVRRQVSLGTICRVVKVLPFGCILRHRRRSLQHVGTSKSKNHHSILDWDWRKAFNVIDKGKVISFPNLSQKEEGLASGTQQALVNQ